MPYICLLQEGNPNLPSFIETAYQNNFSVVAAPINCTDMPLEFEREPMNEKQSQFTYSDLILTPDQWNGKVIAMLTDTIDCDSSDEQVRKNSEETLKRDLSWAEHLLYGGFTMMKLKGANNFNLAKILSSRSKGTVLLQVPLYNASIAQSTWRRDLSEDDVFALQCQDSWQWWNRFRLAAGFSTKMRVVLEFNEAERPDTNVVARWLGEPVEAIILPSTMFIRNRHNYPVLPKVWQEILKLFMHAHVNIIVSTDTNDSSLRLYSDYLNNFRQVFEDTHLFQSYEDVLEIPLQPLNDNLDCYTYDIFEKDPVKYKLYQNAIEAALKDRVKEEEVAEKLTVIMVLGAGRGPLVRAALNASANTGRKVRVYIIEKNPNAIRTLTAVAKKLWYNKDVHIFSKDMREFSPPEQADILVSELLGSFGDNELSPECLDCAQKLLKPDGISIPSKSVSFINPVMSSKLHNAVRQAVHHETYSADKSNTGHNTHSESGFVVLLKNIYNIDKTKALFEFIHPNREKVIDNSRYKVLQFKAELDCILTGIGGYFECVLYNDILMSINPPTHTPGMPSWFPMYFPFSNPIAIKAGQTIEIHFWRCVSKQKIWYEWCLASPFTTHIHNLGGRSQPIYCT